jgi:uncharacterized protein YifN (PemK superfamily)
MPLSYHPEIGTIVICDFDGIEPEMTKKRPAIIVSPRLRNREGLCTVVPLSITEPDIIMPYHYKLTFREPLPPPFDSPFKWVKGDMLATVSLERLNLPYGGKDEKGRRKYITRIVDDIDLRKVRECILHGLALSDLTRHL